MYQIQDEQQPPRILTQWLHITTLLTDTPLEAQPECDQAGFTWNTRVLYPKHACTLPCS